MGGSLVKTTAVAAFALFACSGFSWMLYTLATHILAFFLSLDASLSSLALISAAVGLFLIALYFVFYPQGQKAYS
eukprot:scaffold183649_cov44-Tisochrysis_lutea.AAC.1